jgi:predicted methyltransferase MtxX (methanogen marker protein 4)
MYFEPGKYYKHSSGKMMHTLAIVDSTLYGRTLIAEEASEHGHMFIPVGIDSEDYAQNYVEITEQEWMTNFS